MALLSEIDWVILLGVGGLLLVGPGNGAAIRTLGRYYGRLVSLKRDLLSEFSKAADLPPTAGGAPVSLRQFLLEPAPSAASTASAIPLAVAKAPAYSTRYAIPSGSFATTDGSTSWSVALPIGLQEPGGGR